MFDVPEFKQLMIRKEMAKGKTMAQAIAILSKNPQFGDLFRGMTDNPEQPKEQKLHNEIVEVDGVKFRSRKEANFYVDLKRLQVAGEISGFCIQPKFILVEGKDGVRAITYAADFIIFHNGRIKPAATYEIIDTKGYETKEWKRTYKQFGLKFPALKLKVVKEG